MIFSLKWILLFLNLQSYAGRSQIENFVGHPQITYAEDQVSVAIKKNVILEKTYNLKTGPNDLIKLKLGENFFVVVYPDSSLKLSGIEIENNGYDITEVLFNYGQFLVENKSTQVLDQRIKYKSAFFEWISTDKVPIKSFHIDINMTSALINICAGEEGLFANLFDLELKQNLKKFEAVSFQAEKDGSELAYDYFLEGRKAPKGHWNAKTKCQFSDYLKTVKKIEDAEKTTKKALEQKKQIEQKQIKAEYDKSLCHEPNGQMNQCAWKFENKECVRYRCFGDGRWGDRYALPSAYSDTCTKNPKVSKCDY